MVAIYMLRIRKHVNKKQMRTGHSRRGHLGRH